MTKSPSERQTSYSRNNLSSPEIFLKRIHKISQAETLPSLHSLARLCRKAGFILSNENTEYRPSVSVVEIPGGLIDFTSPWWEKTPVIVVPDIHARADFIYKVLCFRIPGQDMTVLEALEKNMVRIVFAGDILHSERQKKDRWLRAFEDYERGIADGIPMREEMADGLSAFKALFECKCRFPRNVHILKGNHENVKNCFENGNRPFRKYACEGEMVMHFMQDVYGEALLNLYSSVENLLPLAAVFPQCVISHGEPRTACSRSQIIDCPLDGDVSFNFIWTANDEAEEGSVRAVMDSLYGGNVPAHSVYLGGHRPVFGKYALRQDGLFVQIHNPDEENIAIVVPDRPFMPDSDIVSVNA